MREAKGNDLIKSTIKRTLTTTVMIGALTVTGLLTTRQASAASTIHVDQASGTDSSSCGDVADPCATIQQAISNATSGDTITVAAGTYDGNITVNKPLTINGTQAGVDARSRTGAETIVNAPAGTQRGFVVTASNVTIDGLTIDGAAGNSPTTGVYAYNTTSSNLHVMNSIIKNTDIGVDLLSTDRSGLVVSHNLFDHNAKSGTGDGIFISGGTGSNVSITDNTFRDTDDGTAGSTNAILINGGATETLSGLAITGNTSSNDGSFLYIVNTSDVMVKNNTSDAQVGHGVLVGDNVSQLTIDTNTFTNGVSGVRFGAVTTPTTAVTITNNTISGMSGPAIAITAGSITDAPTITDNSITGNAVGIDNQSTVAVNANNNWWGCAAGPGTPGCDSINGPATASVWYTNVAMTAVNTSATDPSSGTTSGSDDLANTGENALAIFDITLLVIALAAGGFVAVRRRMTKN